MGLSNHHLVLLHHSFFFFFQQGGWPVAVVKSRAVEVFLLFAVVLGPRRRQRVLRNGPVPDVTWQIPVSVESPGGRFAVERERRAPFGGDVRDTGVGYHGSVAVGGAPTPCLSSEVQR